MILKSVRLAPFAGWREKEIELKPGLNVVCGPNEAGKSTVFRAIDSCLFLPTKLRANTIEGRELKRLIPLGGDHARVAVMLETEAGTYRIEKLWGSVSESRMTLPDGSALTDVSRIDEALRRLIPTSSGTFRSVLLTPQNALEGTLDELTREGEPVHSLGDVLRAAASRTDGVSVGRLKSLLEKRIEDTFLNWDVTAGTPKKSRGIENPWDRQGPVLQSYYSRERTRKRFVETQAIENALGERTRVLGEKMRRLHELRDFVEKNEKIVDAVSSRLALTLRRDQAEREALSLAKDLDAWIRADADRRVLDPEVKRLEALVLSLGGEFKEARAEISRKSALARFEKVDAARRQVEERKSAFVAIPRLAPDELNRLRAQSLSLEKIRAGVSAGKLAVTLVAKEAMTLSITRDLEKPREARVEAGGSLKLSAGGRVLVSGTGFDLVVTSGEGDLEKLEARLAAETASLAEALGRHGLDSLESAQERSERWMLSGQAMRAAESALGALLGGEPFAALEAQAKAAAHLRAARDPEVVEREYAAANAQLATKKGDLTSAGRALQELARRHGVTDSAALTLQMVKKGVEQETLKVQIEALPPLPDSIGDVPAYVAKFKRAQSELPSLAEEIRLLGNEIVEIKAKLPDQSAQDFDREHREAAATFDRELKAGQAWLRVRNATESVEGGGTDVYGEFNRHLENYVDRLSAGRYGSVKREGALPTEFVRRDGASVPFGWLSAGTKDGFALSLRLAMARYFLSGAQGFLLMDDPMVAMDPVRQKVAAEMLREFGEKTQLVIFTCHPGHADLLGGNRVEV